MKEIKLLKLLLTAFKLGLDIPSLLYAIKTGARKTRRKLVRELKVSETELRELIARVEPELLRTLNNPFLLSSFLSKRNWYYESKARKIFFNWEIWEYQPLPNRAVMARWLKG